MFALNNNISNLNYKVIKKDVATTMIIVGTCATPAVANTQPQNNDTFTYQKDIVYVAPPSNDTFCYQPKAVKSPVISDKTPKEKARDFINWYWGILYSLDTNLVPDPEYMEKHNVPYEFSMQGTSSEELAQGLVENLDENGDGEVDDLEYKHDNLRELEKRDGRVFNGDDRRFYDNGVIRPTFRAMDMNFSYGNETNTLTKKELAANIEALRNDNGNISASDFLTQYIQVIFISEGFTTKDFRAKRREIYDKNQ